MCIGIMLADDHVLVREGIRFLLESEGDFRVAEEAGDGEECVRKLMDSGRAHGAIQVLLLDIAMPGRDGLWTLKQVKERRPELKVIFLTAKKEEEIRRVAMEMGGDGYLSKDCALWELKTAIRSVLDGKKYIQRALTETKKNRAQDKGGEMEKLSTLTEREREVLICVASGMLNKEIGVSLHISEQTVKNHLSSIFRKLDLSDRTQAALFAVRNQIGTSNYSGS